MPKIFFLFVVCAIIALFAAAPIQQHSQGIPLAAPFASTSSRHVVVFSSESGSNYLLYVPLNGTDTPAYVDWHIFLYGSGSFDFIINGSIIESGVSLGAFNFTYRWPAISYANATLVFGGIHYSFHAILTGILTNQVIENVQVSSSYTGQDQFLTVASGVSGALMYPHWIALLESTQNVSYTINVNGQTVMSGHIIGSKRVDFNVSSSTVSVIIGIGSKVYKYPNEIIATVPIQKYYGPKPPPLAYTLVQYEYGIARAFVASIFAIVISLFTARKYLLEKERREVMRI